jgi:hypothetical protein
VHFLIVKNAYLQEVGCDPDGPPGLEKFFNTKMTLNEQLLFTEISPKTTS